MNNLNNHAVKLSVRTFILVIMSCVLILSVVRASITNITYDEAYTYINYVRMFNEKLHRFIFPNQNQEVNQEVNPAVNHKVNQEVKTLGLNSENINIETESVFKGKLRSAYRYLSRILANNHILNSAMISLTDILLGTSYDEFAVRLPNLLAFVLYLFIVWKCYKKLLFSSGCVIFLCMNYYLNEFYGLARGYGIAQTFLFAACIFYIFWKDSGFKDDRYILYCLSCLILSTSANTIVLLIYPALGLTGLYRIHGSGGIKNFVSRHKLFMFSFIALTLFLTAYHFLVSRTGKPLYASSGDFWNSIILEYVRMFIRNADIANIFAVIAAVFTGIAFIFIIVKRDIFKCDFVIMSVIFILTCILMNILTGKGYMMGRVTLPFYGFLVLALRELFSGVFKDSGRYIFRGIIFLMSCFCIVLYISQIDIHYTRDWYSNYGLREKVIKLCITNPEAEHESKHPSEQFYFIKYRETFK